MTSNKKKIMKVSKKGGGMLYLNKDELESAGFEVGQEIYVTAYPGRIEIREER